jgi:hypothetical protein
MSLAPIGAPFHPPSISFSFERLAYKHGSQLFWQSLGLAVKLAKPISSSVHFLEAFASENWKGPVVLLVDELSELNLAFDDIKNDFLRALREIKNHKNAYAIRSVIATGTFSILHLSTTKSSLSPSPFNVSNCIQNPYFSVEETRTLFHMFAQDNDMVIDDEVVEDVWAKSNGYIAQFNNLSS